MLRSPLPRRLPSLALLAVGGLPSLALAEGIDDVGPDHRLPPSNVVYVDILDSSSETIVWQGIDSDGIQGRVEVFDPSGTSLGIFDSGDTITPTGGDGAYEIHFQGVRRFDDWDITVYAGMTPEQGRIWSYDWYFEAPTFNEIDAMSGNFYAVVDGGAPGHDAVVEFLTDGLAGRHFDIYANASGIPGGNGRSLYEADVTSSIPADFPIYLNPPDNANYNPIEPEITDEDFSAGTLDCDTVASGVVYGTFTFESNVDGTYHIVCDLNGDGVFDITSDDDLHLLGDATSGSNHVTWDGTDNTGASIPAGVYECQVWLTTGEFHYVGRDIETSYEGFRLYEVQADATRRGLAMFWNDAEVQSSDVTMPNGDYGLESSGADGIDPGTYGTSATPNVNARSWGQFISTSKGNDAYLDTYAWLYRDIGETFTITVVDNTLDSDGDNLIDAYEDCESGTDPYDPDTDHDGARDDYEVLDLPTDALDSDSDDDGVLDGEEIGDPESPTDTDEDGLINGVDADDDGDGLQTVDEDVEVTDDDPRNDDSDDDGIADYLDEDDDDDGVLTEDEDVDEDGDWWNDDTDGDSIVDYLDPDDDGDGVPTVDEDPDGNGDPTTDNTDGDIVPNYLDPDDDGDGIGTTDEDVETVDGDPTNDDTDDDGVPNYLDPDDDNDTVDTIDEDPDADGDPRNDDTDGDGTANWLDEDDDGDSVLTRDEDPNGNGDPRDDDTDGDGDVNYLDPNDDNDDLPTSDEDPNGDGDPRNDDSDGDGTADYLDPDSLFDPTKSIYQGGGCGCSTPADASGVGATALVAAVALVARRRRR